MSKYLTRIFLSALSLNFIVMPFAFAFEAGCVYNCGGGESSSSSSSSSGGGSSSGSSRAFANLQRLDEQRKQETFNRWKRGDDANKKGNAFYEVSNWPDAIASYKEALRHSPDDKIIQENLQDAIDRLKEDGEKALATRKAEGIREKMQGIMEGGVAGLSSGASSTATLDGLSFQDAPRDRVQDVGSGASGRLFEKGTKHSAPVVLDFMDASPPEEILEVPDDLKDAPSSAPTESMVQKAKEAKSVVYLIGGLGFDTVSSLDPEFSQAEYKQALNHLPMNARAHALLGAASVKLGRYDEAIAQLEKAEKAAPDDEGIQKAIGHVMAIKDGKQPFKANPKTELLLDALEEGKGDWIASIQSAHKRLKNETDPQRINDINENIQYFSTMSLVDHMVEELLDTKYEDSERELKESNRVRNTGDPILDEFLGDLDEEILRQRKEKDREKAWDQILEGYSK